MERYRVALYPHQRPHQQAACETLPVLPAVLFCNNLHRYVAGGSLADVIASKTLDEQCIAVTVREVLKGLKYLHSQGKIHR